MEPYKMKIEGTLPEGADPNKEHSAIFARVAEALKSAGHALHNIHFTHGALLGGVKKWTPPVETPPAEAEVPAPPEASEVK